MQAEPGRPAVQHHGAIPVEKPSDHDRGQKRDQRIPVPGLGQVSVEQLIEGARPAATRTQDMSEHVKGTDRIKMIVLRRKTIEHAAAGEEQAQQNIGAAFHSQPRYSCGTRYPVRFQAAMREKWYWK